MKELRVTNYELRSMKDFAGHGDTVLIEACVLAGDCEFVTCTVGRQHVKVKPEQVHPFEMKSKYAPCRLFKKGDIVRVVEWTRNSKNRNGGHCCRRRNRL